MIGEKRHYASEFPFDGANEADWQSSRVLRETFLLLFRPSWPFWQWKEMGTLQHFVPLGLSCYKPAMKCDSFCHSCAHCWQLLLFGCGGNQSWDPGLSTQRRADFIFQTEMPSGTLPPALDLNRQDLLGQIEGWGRLIERSDWSLMERHKVYILCQHRDIRSADCDTKNDYY